MTIESNDINEKDMPTIAFRTIQEDVDRLQRRHPRKGDKSRVMRSLLQMYLDGKIRQKLEFVQRTTV